MKKDQFDRSERARVHREMFWHNVMREFLTGLSVTAMSGNGALEAAAGERGDATTDAGEPQSKPSLFDGRLGIITTSGTRIPIAGVYPLFACGIQGTDAERALSMDVECTIFQIHTPEGEVYTLPLHEIVGFHAVGEEAMDKINAAAEERSDTDGEPFGFAAFTSLAKQAKGPNEPEAGHAGTPKG